MKPRRLLYLIPILLSLLVVTTSLTQPTTAAAQSGGEEWHVIWEWTADQNANSQPSLYGARYGTDGGVQHIELDGSASSGSAIYFDNQLLTPQSTNLRITITYRNTHLSSSPRLRFANPDVFNDAGCQPTNQQFGIASSSVWVTNVYNFNHCSLQVGDDYLFSLRNVGTTTQRWQVRSVSIESFFFLPPPPPVGATCVITSTETITGAGGITSTTIISTVVSANLLENPSFEQVESSGKPRLLVWEFSYPLFAVSYHQPVNPYDGEYALRGLNLPFVNLSQRLTLPASEYLFGAQVAYEGDTEPPGSIRLGGSLLAVPPVADHDYQLKDSTTTLAAGTYTYTIGIPDTQTNDATFFADSAFLIPMNGDGVNCPLIEELYNGGELGVGGGGGGGTKPPIGGGTTPGTTPGTGAGIPVPVGGAGTVCYTCYFPSGRGLEALIAWLGCVMRNLFSCDLRIWLANINNAVLGVFALLVGWAQWSAVTTQGGANWAAGGVNGALSASSQMYVQTTNQFANAAHGAVRIVENIVGVGLFLSVTTQGGANWAADSVNRFLEIANQMYINMATILVTVNTPPGGGGNDPSPLGWLYMFLELIPRTIASIADVFNSLLGLGSATISFLASLIWLILNLLKLLVEPLAIIVSLLQGIIEAVVMALSAPPLGFDEFTAATGGITSTDASTVDGMGYLAFMWGIALVDALIMESGLFWVVWAAAAVVAITTLIWLFEIWDLGDYVGG